MPLDRLWIPLQRVWTRMHLTLGAALAIVAGLVALAGSTLVFAAMSEDVTRRNGMALHDASDLKFFTLHRSALDVHAAKLVTEIGSVPIVLALAFIAALLLWRHGERLVIALAPIGALALAAALTGIVKVIVGRTRPPVPLHLVAESDASFPSGHATNSAAFFMTVAFITAVFVLRRPLARVAVVVGAGLVASSVAVSRLVLGVHWPSDVIAGMALGLTCALVVTMAAALYARLEPRPPSEGSRRLQRIGHQVQRTLLLEHRPRGELRAA
jgi:undecaprenyl-diphosphatase